MRYSKQKSTGRIIETQTGGDPSVPSHLESMIQNAVNAGFDQNDIEVGFEEDAVVNEWMRKQSRDIPAEISAEASRRISAASDPRDNIQKRMIAKALMLTVKKLVNKNSSPEEDAELNHFFELGQYIDLVSKAEQAAIASLDAMTIERLQNYNAETDPNWPPLP